MSRFIMVFLHFVIILEGIEVFLRIKDFATEIAELT